MNKKWACIFHVHTFELEYVPAERVCEGFDQMSLEFLGVTYTNVYVNREEISDVDKLDELEIFKDERPDEESRLN